MTRYIPVMAKTRLVQVRVDERTWATLSAIAAARGISEADFFRECLNAGIRQADLAGLQKTLKQNVERQMNQMLDALQAPGLSEDSQPKVRPGGGGSA